MKFLRSFVFRWRFSNETAIYYWKCFIRCHFVLLWVGQPATIRVGTRLFSLFQRSSNSLLSPSVVRAFLFLIHRAAFKVEVERMKFLRSFVFRWRFSNETAIYYWKCFIRCHFVRLWVGQPATIRVGTRLFSLFQRSSNTRFVSMAAVASNGIPPISRLRYVNT